MDAMCFRERERMSTENLTVVKTRMTNETEYGNRMMYAEIQNRATDKSESTVEYNLGVLRNNL